MPCPIIGREDQYELLTSFLPNKVHTAPRTMILQGNASTGKTYTLTHYLKSLKVNYSLIQCDQCISPKILWKRVLTAIQVDSKIIRKHKVNVDPLTSSSFQGFLKAAKDFITKHKYKKLHYIVLDRADQVMEDDESVFIDFSKLQEVLQAGNISIIFVIGSTTPRKLITSSIPTIHFPNYTSDEVIKILTKEKLCSFPESLLISEATESVFWTNYVQLIVDSFFTYTTDILVLRRILIRLWDKFIRPIVNDDVNANEFHKVYRQNYGLLTSEYAVEHNAILDTQADDNDDEDDHDDNDNDDNEEVGQTSSTLSNITKYIIIAAYIASFNDQKQDWKIFSKTRDYQKRRMTKTKRAKVSSRLLDASAFDLERLLAITHAIYEAENSKTLITDLDLTTQIANLSSLRLLLKSHTQDYINPKVKWKANVSYDFIKSVAKDIGFQIENYLIE